MVVKVRHSERRAFQPGVPHRGVAENLDTAVGDRVPAHDRQQQIRGRPTQRDVALAVVVGPGHPILVVDDRPLAGRTEPRVGGMQVQRAPTVDRGDCRLAWTTISSIHSLIASAARSGPGA